MPERSVASTLGAFLAEMAALAGAALLVLDAPGVLAGGPAAILAVDATLVAAGVLARGAALSGWRDGVPVAVAVLVSGIVPSVAVAHRWWIAAGAGAGLAAIAPHLLAPPRARLWVAGGVLLAAAAFEAGWLAGIVTPLAALAVGVSSGRLARGLGAITSRTAWGHERALEAERHRAADLEAEAGRGGARGRVSRHSFVRVAFTRRLGAIGAIGSAIARELRLAGAAGEPRLRETAGRCAAHADHIARLAMGGAAREDETTLGLLWARVREQVAGRMQPDHHVEWKVPSDLAPLAGSGSEWVQILSALAENAFQAMPHGGVLVITAGVADVPGRARVVVEDNGAGIAPALLPHVLEPFHTSHADEGAEGLGLALVASMVEALEGTITVASAPGRGTRVEIDVPFYAPAVPVGVPIRFEGTVLLADDSRDLRHALRRLLESLGLDVVEADSGTLALAHFASAPHDFRALLLDVVMPGTPVEEIVVRARELRPDVPVLLISGYDVSRLLEGVVALGGVRFLTKPLVREDLISSLRDLLTVRAP
jgi:signal transduction histidine kinase